MSDEGSSYWNGTHIRITGALKEKGKWNNMSKEYFSHLKTKENNKNNFLQKIMAAFN